MGSVLGSPQRLPHGVSTAGAVCIAGIHDVSLSLDRWLKERRSTIKPLRLLHVILFRITSELTSPSFDNPSKSVSVPVSSRKIVLSGHSIQILGLKKRAGHRQKGEDAAHSVTIKGLHPKFDAFKFCKVESNEGNFYTSSFITTEAYACQNT